MEQQVTKVKEVSQIEIIEFELPESKYQITFDLKEKEVEISIRRLDRLLEAGPFKEKFTLKSLIEKHKYFKVLENINEFVSFIKDSIKKKEIEITINSKLLTLGALATFFQKKEYVYFTFFQKELDKDYLIALLCQEIDKCNQKIHSLNKKVCSLEDLVREKVGLGDPDFFNSYILSNTEQINFLMNVLRGKLKTNIKTFNKIYQASRDGDFGIRFHLKSDGFSNWLMLIKTNKDYIFGGFSSLILNSEYKGYFYDSKAFIFSLNNMKVYEGFDKSLAVYFDKNYLPRFGDGHDIYIENYCLSNSSSYCNQKTYDYEGSLHALAGEYNFQPIEIEIFHVVTE